MQHRTTTCPLVAMEYAKQNLNAYQVNILKIDGMRDAQLTSTSK